MPKFAANLSMLFTEAPFLERFELARRAGFRFVEFQFPYAFALSDVQSAARESGVQVVLFNLPAGDFAGGERGIAANPAKAADFRASVQQALDYAQALDCAQLNCLVGKRDASMSERDQREWLIGNLRFAVSELSKHGRTLLLEMLNPFDAPNFLLPTPSVAFALCDEVGAPNVKVQYDVYHAQRTEGELVGTLTRRLTSIGHVQIADNPGRHQPGTGEINYPHLLRALDEIGYAGYVGCEYVPEGGTLTSLSWMNDYGFAL
jgi:hydroxypyruvate isomerase